MISELQVRSWISFAETPATLTHLDISEFLTCDGRYPVSQGGSCDVYKGRFKQRDGFEAVVAIKCLRVNPNNKEEREEVVENLSSELLYFTFHIFLRISCESLVLGASCNTLISFHCLATLRRQ